jgi:uncharacterized protein YuzE
MAELNVNQILRIVPDLLKIPAPQMWADYDQEADVLYITFKRPSQADDSEIINDSQIVRYQNGEVVGITIMNASQFIE